MEHFYENIDGWFDFESIYKNAVEKFDSGSHFVEIGSWLGRSTSYMAVEILNSNKNIKFDCIDTWEGSIDETYHGEYIKNLDKSLYQQFLENIRPVSEYINPIQGWSYDIVNQYEDNSIDFIFIDGAHDYESVKRDINDWYPKVKKNGIIAGHDYNIGDWPGVVQAVNEFFGKNMNIVKKDNWSWIVDKNEFEKSKNMSICLYTMVINEEIILPFFLDYYTNYIGVNKIVIYDGGSTDKSHEIINSYSNTKLILEQDEFTDSKRDLRVWNEEWKKDRNDYDWMIVCTPDEFLYHSNVREKLLEYQKNKITIPRIEGFDMISIEHPKFEKGKYLPQIIKRGIKDDIFMNKNIIFNPKELNINYEIGCHACKPTGNVIFSENYDFKLLHFKKLSHQFLINDSKIKNNRLSQWMVENNGGYHYKLNSVISYKEYENIYNKSYIILNRIITPTYSYIENENKLEIFIDRMLYAEVSIFTENDELIYSSISNFNNNKFWYRPDRNLFDINIIKVKIKDMNGDITIEDKYMYLKNKLYKYEVDNKIENITDLEKLKIIQLNELENIMKIENSMKNDIIIQINNPSFENGKVKKLLPYLFNNGYEKINDSTFKKIKQKNIYIFSHNYLINDWKNIFEEQLDKLNYSGLYKNSKKLFLFAYGDDDQWNIFKNIILIYDIDKKIEIKRFDDNFYEYYTLQYLWDFCNTIEESYILYFHLKGVWSSKNLQINNQDEFDINEPIRNPDAIKKWRNCLEYFNIERWYNCIDKLNEGYDTVGALYNYNPVCPIYTGNFWWSNSNHIKKLEYPVFEKNKEPYDAKLWIRIKCEKWINIIPNNFYNLYNPKDLGLYIIPIDEKDYRDDINPLISILTPTYNRHENLKNAINSALKQTYINWEMLICSDGQDNIVKNIIESYNDNRIKYYFTEMTNDHGASQRNFLTKSANGKFIIYLDDNNVIYSNLLGTLVNNFEKNTGMIIYRINYDGLDHCLPIEDKIILGKIDTLNFCVDKYYTKNAIWNNYIEHDYEVMKICENNILNHNKIVKFIPDVLGRHVDMNKSTIKYTFITPTYKRYNTLKRCIDSVIKQKYINWEMLICSDGDDKNVENIIKNYNDNRIQYFFTEQTNFFGTHQRNYLLNKTNGDYIIFLDDNNYLYDNHLKIINDNISNSDMLIYKIHFENYEYNILPLENKIEHRKIDTLNFVIKKDLSTTYKWKKIYEHDYLYFKSIEADIVENNGKIKYIQDILAIHTDKSKIIE